MDGDIRAILDPGDDRLSGLTGQGNSAFFRGSSAHGYDVVLRWKIGVGEKPVVR